MYAMSYARTHTNIRNPMTQIQSSNKSNPTGWGHPCSAGADACAGGGDGRVGSPDGGARAGMEMIFVYIYI